MKTWTEVLILAALTIIVSTSTLLETVKNIRQQRNRQYKRLAASLNFTGELEAKLIKKLKEAEAAALYFALSQRRNQRPPQLAEYLLHFLPEKDREPLLGD